jgi:hypothetical protein
MSTIVLLVLIGLVSGSCGEDEDSGLEPTPTTYSIPTTAPATPTTATPTTATPTTAPLEQPAIWPAVDTVFISPDQAAEDFVASVLAVPPRFGEFQAGDSRSGEIEVLAPAETDDDRPPAVRSVLLLRRLGPADSWFVLAAINDNTTITSPESGTQVTPGIVTVTGVGRGFEGLVVVEAFRAGHDGALDQVITQGGSAESPEPYEVNLDLSDAAPGDTVVVVVRGGVGLETDPGEFSAIALKMTNG